jgi:hypothetical protein
MILGIALSNHPTPHILKTDNPFSTKALKHFLLKKIFTILYGFSSVVTIPHYGLGDLGSNPNNHIKVKN